MDANIPPIVPKTLVEYLNHFSSLRALNPDLDPSPELLAARFALTGITSDDSFLAGITTTPDILTGSPLEPYVRRDLDSILGYCRSIPVKDSIDYYPYPNILRTLERPVHLKYVANVRNEWIDMDPGTVPNFHFAYFGHRHSLRMFFPRLKSEDRHSVRLTAQELRSLYDNVIRPAAVVTMPDIVHDWPASFSTAEWKDRNARRGFSHSSYTIPEDRMSIFSDQLRYNIDHTHGLGWAKDFFWGVEMRGVKDACSHAVDAPPVEMAHAFHSLLWNLTTDEGIWYGDVALEFMLPGQALLWSTNGHPELLEHLLFLTPDEANRTIANSRCYFRDTTTHIMSLSGFRADFSRLVTGGIGPLCVSYVQAYQTDKGQTYHPEGSRFSKTLTAKLAVQGNPPSWCQSLLQVFSDASGLVDVATRFEARMPLGYVFEAYRRVNLAVVKRTLVCYTRDLWWDFRSSKMWSATMLLSMVNSDSLRVRMLQGSLLLVGALVYYINCLHSRPDDGSQARNLCRAIFPLTHDAASPHLLFRSRNDEGGQGLPYGIGGVMHLRDIFLKPIGTTYRFVEVRLIDEDVFKHAIGCFSEDVVEFLFKECIQRHRPMQGYVPQRKGYTKRRAPREEEELERQFPDLEDVVHQVIGETAEGHPAPPEELRIGDRLEKILQQYATDIIQKCGNPRMGQANVASYCHLVQYDRQQISFDDINTLDLGRIFTQVQWQRGTPDDWDQAFDRIFPPAKHIDPHSMSHFARCQYYTWYKNLMLNLSEEDFLQVRATLRNKIGELAWIPSTKSDRLWDYSLGDRSWKKGPDPKERGPRILINSRVPGRVNTAQPDFRILEGLEADADNARRVALRQEEEEESEEDMPVQRNQPLAAGSSRGSPQLCNHTRSQPYANGSSQRNQHHQTPVRRLHTEIPPPAAGSSQHTRIQPHASGSSQRGLGIRPPGSSQHNQNSGTQPRASRVPDPLDDESDSWLPPSIHRAFRFDRLHMEEEEEEEEDIYCT